MTKRFPIQELEALIYPDDLVDCLDSLMDNNKISSYYYDYEGGEIELDIPDSLVIEELFSSDQINSKGEVH